jgi:hypothetical protein
MFRILIAVGLVAVGAVPAAAQTSAPRPLPPATVARMRADAPRLHANARRERSAAVPGLRAPPPDAAFTPRPPKARPVG